MTVRTEKQAAIADALRRSPQLGDSAVARETGTSRNLVRRIRARLGLAPPAAAAQEGTSGPKRSVPWSPALDPVFSEGGFADELEGFVVELVELGGRLDKRLAEIEVHARGHFVRNDRHRLIREIYRLAAAMQRELVPAGPCPFCSTGCARCTGGGWAPASTVDAGALLEERNGRSRWWRVPRVQVPM